MGRTSRMSSEDNAAGEGLPVVRLDPRTMQPADPAAAVGGLPVDLHPPTGADAGLLGPCLDDPVEDQP